MTGDVQHNVTLYKKTTEHSSYMTTLHCNLALKDYSNCNQLYDYNTLQSCTGIDYNDN